MDMVCMLTTNGVIMLELLWMHWSNIPTAGNSDYSSLSTSLTFLPGDNVNTDPRCVSINILDDDVVESVELFSVDLSSSSVIQAINTTSVNVTIFEDPLDCKY